ncbi:MAG TPA: PTS fructose transporter subunit IIC [Candidatus Enterocloster excrementipullorum]|uniref:PTS fructose transporter subunit IIC n=1 Tax=Candidatus Enterocloster excrementipullorum TaxID=2838559 RepID=A0A9D2SG55_9FIRM|nr:PTS fructose transporter subunit IIC [Candidatus Enterocloster excrementipullorum]
MFEQFKASKIKKHILTAIGYMIPLVVASGLCMALGQVIDSDVRNSTTGIGYFLYQAGNFGMSAVVPVITAGVAYSICDRPGIAPGLILGFICTAIKAGFIGGIVAGFLVGFIVILLKNYVKLPKSMQGLMPVMVIPVLTTAIASVLMYTVVGIPFTWLMNALTEFITGMQNSSKFLFGAVLGGMACFDFGGPVNKTMSTFVNGLMIDGVLQPEAVKFVGSMIPPFGIAISCLLTPKKYTRQEKESLKAAVPMGFCMITEGVIPIAARDLVRVVFACVCGSAIAGGLSMVWGCGSPVPHGGMLTVPLFDNPVMFCVALLIGSVITGVILSLIKKVPTEADELGGADYVNPLDIAGGTEAAGASSVKDGDIHFENFN